jgi:hypothetical protein
MTQVIIYTNENGNVSVCTPTGELPIEDVLAKDCPKGAVIVDRSDLPESNIDFIDAWRLNKGKVTIDLSSAKEITKTRLRAERTKLLQAQDVAFQRALESGADTAAIVAEKQRLRDLPTLADAATTLDELRGLKACQTQ